MVTPMGMLIHWKSSQQSNSQMICATTTTTVEPVLCSCAVWRMIGDHRKTPLVIFSHEGMGMYLLSCVHPRQHPPNIFKPHLRPPPEPLNPLVSET